MKQLQRLKKVFNWGVNYGWISKTPFSNYKIKFKPYDKVILTAEELEKVENLKGLSPKLEMTRDAFIFSCYTGLAYVDLRQLTKDNIIIGVDGNPWIITRRKKTDIKARIPLLPKALALIEKYKDHRKLKDGQVIPIYSNQKTNDYLKEIANKAEISKPLSFHCGRHIFATVITLANGVPIETVSKALGHTDIRTTQVYARVLDEKIAKDFGILKNKL
jgi:integrase/recombinase XerD